MKLIIDANILMSALISTEGVTYDLIFNDNINLFVPEFLNYEVNKYKNEIIKKSGLSVKELDLFFSLLTNKIEFIPKIEFLQFFSEAKKISPDKNDFLYFALALKLNCCIWSNDKKLKNQNKIIIYNTNELISEMY
jgi:predicted nucleic acid-binding protein